jgi:hypothetical protein
MRFHPTRGAMTIGQSKGGLPPDEVCEEQAAVLKDMERLIAEFHDNSKCATVYPSFQQALWTLCVEAERQLCCRQKPCCLLSRACDRSGFVVA